jgi:conjugative relaxase-like TrwC/TraI family protein
VAYYFRGQGPGQWVGQGSAILGVEGEVQRRDLVQVLQGRHPGDGHFLPARKPSRRRAGWDLTLAAPKSVSLLAALATAGGDDIVTAHRAAVAGVLADLECRLLGVRRAGAPGGVAPTAGAVAAAFDHHANASGEPHLHTHLLLGNLGRDDRGVWSSVTNEWWTGQRALGALYQLGLRHHLRAGGLALDWRIQTDGLADLAGVPRAAVRATSGRSRAAAADRAAFREQPGGQRLGVRTRATIQSRGPALLPPWRLRTRAAGFGSDDADRLMEASRARAVEHPAGGPPEGSGRLEGPVTSWLAAQRSSFRRADVLIALAACSSDGMGAQQAAGWAERFCQAAAPVPTAPTASPRWTTERARSADRRFFAQAQQVGPPTPRSRAGGRADLVSTTRSSTEGRDAVLHLLSDGRRVHILHAPPGRTNLLAQAGVLEVAAFAWRSAGLRVAVATATDLAALRWSVLTGIEPYRSGGGAEVLIVDQADRRTTAELLAVLAGHDQLRTIVMVEGGTTPRLSWMRSDGLALLGDRVGRLDPGPPPVWAPHVGPRTDTGAVGRLPRACPSGTQAAGVLLHQWAEGCVERVPAVLVGLGYAEVDGLNQAARAILADRSRLTGPALSCGERIFQAGDRVITLRRLSADLPGGTLLEVTEVDRRRSALTVSGTGIRATLDRATATHLGYRYAITVGLAARTTGPLLVLGPEESLGPHRGRVVGSALVGRSPEPPSVRISRRQPGPGRQTSAVPEWDRGAGLGIG